MWKNMKMRLCLAWNEKHWMTWGGGKKWFQWIFVLDARDKKMWLIHCCIVMFYVYLGGFACNELITYWKGQYCLVHKTWNEPEAVVGWKSGWKFCQNGDLLQWWGEEAFAWRDEVFLKFLERFFNLSGHLVEVMVSITVPCNYSLILTRNGQYLNWVGQMLFLLTCRFLNLVKTLFSYTNKHKVPLYLL